jgi:mannose-6-phosphate isomerase-like protein (cupin superfamily)
MTTGTRSVLLAVAVATAGAGVAYGGGEVDPLTGVKTKRDLDELVAKLRTGEVAGAQTLFERENGPYRIYTSYIDNRKGGADIHVVDDEIFVVLSGSAQLTLGGDITDKKLARENEYRGTAIAGGSTRPVAAGDIISAPRGTPHQMDPGAGHILYIVIKVMGQR